MKLEAASPVSYEKDGKTYRIYEEDPQDKIQMRVKNHYYNMHQLQTVDFVREMVRSHHFSKPTICSSIISG